MKHAKQTINDLEDRLQELEAESRKIKSAINCLCDVIGLPPKYKGIEDEHNTTKAQRADESESENENTLLSETGSQEIK